MAFPGDNYAPPAPYVRTRSENPISGSLDTLKIPVFIGEGNEFLVQRNLEVVRGSSATIDQRKAKEDTTGRAVVSISDLGVVTLGDWDGVLTRLQVRDIPIVTGDGSGVTSNSRSDVSVIIDGLPIVVLSVDGTNGIVELAQPPAVGADVRISYFFNRTDTLITDDLSDQVSTDPALVRAPEGVSDVNAPNNLGETVVLRADVLGVGGVVITPGNNNFLVTVDGLAESVLLAPGTYTMQQAANLISSASLGTLTASTFINNFGDSALSLSATNDITVGSGSANADLGLVAGQTTTRRRTFYTFQGPIVDGTNGGVTTTDTAHVTVKVDGVQVIPDALDGASRAVTLTQAPKVGAVVTVAYWFNSWQDTFDYLAHNNVTEVSALGEVPDSSSFNEGADFILKGDKILWGTAWTVEGGTTSTTSTELFDDSQISGTLIDNRTYLSGCSPVILASGGSAVESKTRFQLPFDPTLGNGRSTPLGSSLFQTVSNGRIDLPVNRPDVVDAYWGYGVQDALARGKVDVVKVEGNLIDLAAEVPTGATVYASFYYNMLTDNEYTVTASLIGQSGIGQYTVDDQGNNPIRNIGFSTGDKGTALNGVELVWPSGSELTPDTHFEGVSGTDFIGPLDEIVTVQLEVRDATPAKFAAQGFGPYEFILNQSDQVRIRLDNSELDAGVGGISLADPTTHGNGAPAILTGAEIVYDGGTGATVGQSYSLAGNEDAVFYIDGVEIPVTIPAQNNVVAATLDNSINEAANGVGITTDAGGSTTTIIVPAATPGSGINGYYEGWEIIVGATSGNVVMAPAEGDVRVITSYVSATRVATVAAWTAAGDDVNGGSLVRLANPETMAQYKGATQFNGPVDLTAHNDIRFTYTGDFTGVYSSAVISLGAGPYASAAALATAIEAGLNGAAGWVGAGPAFGGAGFVVEADASGRITVKCRAAGDDATAYFCFVSAGIVAADSLAILAGLSTAAATGGGQAHLMVAGDVAKTFSVVAASGNLSHDRVQLRNRLIPASESDDLSASDFAQMELRVGAGTVLSRLGFESGDFGAGGASSVLPASLSGAVGFVGGQNAATSEPLVTFFDGTGVQAINDTLELTIDGSPITVTFTSVGAGTATDLGPASGASNGSVLDQIIDALAAVPGAPFGANAAAVFANGLVYQFGAGIALESSRFDVTSLVEITGGTAVSALGFTAGDLAQRLLPDPRTLASALNSNRHATFATWMGDFSAVNPNPNEMFATLGIATVIEDSAGNDFLFLQSKSLGTSSIVEMRDPTVAAVVTDSWLFPGTGVNSADLDGAVGEAALDGFFVISNQPNGSGTADDSVLNNGTGSDGVVGQTYRDAVTGLTFTLLPRGFHDNQSGPWVAYPVGANATFRLAVSQTFTTDANLPHNALNGLDLKVANTLGMTVGDTSVVSTFERGGLEPLVGDVYYANYTYQKDDFSTAFFTKLASIEAAYGEIHPDNPVTLAAFLATLNGALLVGIKQVEREDGSNYASIETYRDAITELEGVLPGGVTIDIITPLRGDSTELYQLLSRSNSIQSSIRYRAERTSIIGMSSGKLPTDATDLAQILNSDRMRMVYPDMAIIQLTDAFGVTKEHLVDGPMLASALVGSVVSPSVDVATPWTNRRLVGFSQLGRRLDAVEANQVAQKGVTVLEEKPPFLKVRHGLTTDMSNVLTKTPTVKMISDEVQRQSRTVLERFIGIKFLPGILSQIEGRLAMMLKSLVKQQIISAYTGVEAKVAPDDPTVAEVEAFYSPVFPLLYIILTFHLRASL